MANTAADSATSPAKADVRTVTLDNPIQRGEATIASVEVRRPKSGELRGLNLRNLTELDYGTLEALLPRITTPPLTKQDVANLDPSDLMQLGAEVVDFLLPKRVKAELPAA